MARSPLGPSRTAASRRRRRPARAPAAAASALALFAFAFLLTSSTARSAPFDADGVAAALERKYDAGVQRDLASAQACYRLALARSAAGDATSAVRLLESASAFDPDFPDAHFTLARISLFSDPGRAVSELTEAFRTLTRSYPWQRYLLANMATAAVVIWMLSLLLAVIGIVVRHLPHLVHVVAETLGARRSAVGRAGAAAVALAPVLWGLGAVATGTVYAGLLTFRLGKREALLVLLFVASALALAAGMGVIGPWAGAPRLLEPSLLVDRALSSGHDAELARALEAWEKRDSNEALYPLALGTMARRGGDLDRAERELTLAAVLRPNTAWVLTNLGNVAFAREDYARARQIYESAAAADPNAVEPHYNLAQVYTKQLMFAEASREQSRASAVAFDRVRDMSRVSAPQLNRTVMDAAPPVDELWGLARRTANLRGASALEGNRFLAFAGRLVPPSPFALVFLPALFLLFAGVGQFLGRSLATLHCSNCQKIVCRRCVHRMQQRAFCDECYRTVKDLKSMEFTRLLLTRRDQSAARRRTIGQAIVTFLLPGAGQMLRGAALSGFFALLVMTTAGLLVVQNGALLPSLDVLPIPGGDWAKRAPLLVLFFVTYAITVARFFATTTSKVERLAPGGSRGAARRESASRAQTGRS
ncbi:MAG TPA: tetratricopeptide repeat protein [Candidatus Eisenbacteria bacterium]